MAAERELAAAPEAGGGVEGRRLRICFFVTYFPKISEVFLPLTDSRSVDEKPVSPRATPSSFGLPAS